MKPRYLHDGDPWMLAEEIPDCDFYFLQIWTSGFVKDFLWPAGRTFRKVLSIHRGYHLWFYFGEKDSNRIGEFLVEKFIKQPRFAQRVNREIVRTSDRLRAFAERLPAHDLEKSSNQDLWRLYLWHDQLHTQYYQWGWIPVAVDMFHGNLTERLKQYLRDRHVPEEQLNEYFVILTQPTEKSLVQIEREGFLRLAAAIQNDTSEQKKFVRAYRSFKKIRTNSRQNEHRFERHLKPLVNSLKPSTNRKIQAHYQKYFYVNHMWVGAVFSPEHYLGELATFFASGLDARKVLRTEQLQFHLAVKKRVQLLNTLRISGLWRALFDAFGSFMVTKIYRRYAQIYALYRMEAVLVEIGRRFGMTLKQVRFIMPSEVQRALRTGRVDRVTINRRLRFCVHYCERNREMIFTGAAARKLAREAERRPVGAVTELVGQTACIGLATGIVKIIIRPNDMHKMRKGDILVSIATDPDIVPAMKKASAIVTEQGGVTSHAAIVSRELNIPCIIGTKIATRVLKDGDRVEVDATKGIVRRIDP